MLRSSLVGEEQVAKPASNSPRFMSLPSCFQRSLWSNTTAREIRWRWSRLRRSPSCLMLTASIWALSSPEGRFDNSRYNYCTKQQIDCIIHVALTPNASAVDLHSWVPLIFRAEVGMLLTAVYLNIWDRSKLNGEKLHVHFYHCKHWS